MCSTKLPKPRSYYGSNPSKIKSKFLRGLSLIPFWRIAIELLRPTIASHLPISSTSSPKTQIEATVFKEEPPRAYMSTLPTNDCRRSPSLYPKEKVVLQLQCKKPSIPWLHKRSQLLLLPGSASHVVSAVLLLRRFYPRLTQFHYIQRTFFFFSPKLNKLSDREQQFAIFLSFFKILFLFFTFGNSFYSCPVLFLKQISFLILA